MHKVLARLGMNLEISIDRSDVLSSVGVEDPDPLHCLISSAATAGIILSEAEFEDTDQPRAFEQYRRQSESSAHSAPLALHTRRPCQMRRWLSCVQWGRGNSAIRSRSIRAVSS